MQASAKSAVNGNESSSSSDDDSSDDFEAAKSQSISQQMRRQLAGKTSTPAAAATPPNKRHDVGGAGDASRLSLKKTPAPNAVKQAKNTNIQPVASPNKRKVIFYLSMVCCIYICILETYMGRSALSVSKMKK